ncbi:acyltransferase [Paenibacillus thailandensis]|uniref:Acyltransferase n=1 Tax=Paenibacillus thailandensis TaxID=393250 RepID=A0ABW5R1G5_9BACL
MSTAITRRDKIPELQLVRAFAIIGVLSVHSTSFATVEMMNYPHASFLYNFFNIFMKFGTPTFILLSSFVLFYNYYSRPLDRSLIGGFYKKRLLYIIIPYLLFSLVYFVNYRIHSSTALSAGETLRQLWQDVATGTANTHLYFVFISIQFYLLFPLFLWLLKRFPALAACAVPIGIAIQWAFVLVNKYGLAEPVPNKGSWSLSYFSYYFMGAALGIYFPRIKNWIVMSREHATPVKIAAWTLLWAAWLAAGLSHVYIWHQTRTGAGSYNSLLYEGLWNLHTFLSALVLMQLAFVIYRYVSGPLASVLGHLGAMSFGIYLIHPLFLYYYRLFHPQAGSPYIHVWYLGGFAVALIASWAVVTLTARYVPFNWIIFGSLPKRRTGADKPAHQARKQQTPKQLEA